MNVPMYRMSTCDVLTEWLNFFAFWTLQVFPIKSPIYPSRFLCFNFGVALYMYSIRNETWNICTTFVGRGVWDGLGLGYQILCYTQGLNSNRIQQLYPVLYIKVHVLVWMYKIMHKLLASYDGLTRLHLGLQKNRPLRYRYRYISEYIYP